MLETALNNSSKRSDLMEAYFGKNKTALSKLPWEETRPDYGIYPLHKFFYVACEKGDEGAVIAVVREVHSRWQTARQRARNKRRTQQIFRRK